MTPPPIPVACARRPTTRDGLVIPYGNVQLADGGCDFRSHHNTRWTQCWVDSLCQVCGTPTPGLRVFLCGPRQLAGLLFDEPPVHPECARYVTLACPMVAGQRERYHVGDTLAHRSRGARCPDPDCDCGGWVPTPGVEPGPGGGPAHEWYAVYATGYHLAATPARPLTGGACLPEQVRRVRLVSRPGHGAYERWLDVPDWLDRYTPPRLADQESQP